MTLLQKFQTVQTLEQLRDFYITFYSENYNPDLNIDTAIQAFNYGLQGIEYLDCDTKNIPVSLYNLYDNINYVGYLVYLYDDLNYVIQYLLENAEWGE